jgi:catechol 2,3-dioxygenase-like lactoylglutathione lyase family enzyme
MTVELSHTIIAATDRDQAADFLVDVLGLEPAASRPITCRALGSVSALTMNRAARSGGIPRAAVSAAPSD